MIKTLKQSNQKCPYCGFENMPIEEKNNSKRLTCKCGFSGRWNYLVITDKAYRSINVNVEKQRQKIELEEHYKKTKKTQETILKLEKEVLVSSTEKEVKELYSSNEERMRARKAVVKAYLKKQEEESLKEVKAKSKMMIEDAKLKAQKILNDAKAVVKTKKARLTNGEKTIVSYSKKFILANDYAPKIEDISNYICKPKADVGRMVINIEKKGHLLRTGGRNQYWEFL